MTGHGSRAGRQAHLYRRPITRLPLPTENAANPLIAALVARRKELGLTQRAVADRMEVRQPWVARFESDQNPRLETIVRYALAVDALMVVELKELLPNEAQRSGVDYESARRK